jgi:uncharacterized NAD(P)/FAD-binding protein YdhS
MSVRTKAIRLDARATKGRLRLVGRWGKQPLEDLLVACAASGAIDKLIRQTVADARRQGCTWSEIGDALGMSKQSAWERFSGEK